MNILTLIKISWRNVWRNKLRSIVVIVSVVFGILGGIIMIAMSYGLNEERMNNAVETYLSHIQIHNESFSEDYNIKHTIDNLEAIENAINNDSRVVSYSRNEVKRDLIPYSSDNIIEAWDDISKDLAYANEMLAAVLYIFMMIILSGLSFGIVNTMLMAILERKKEIGMLMSIGMSRYKIFLMICFETIFLSIVALPFGLIFSYLIVEYYSVVGIDLSIVEAGLENFGVGTRMYFKVPDEQYFIVSIMVFIIAVISSIFPSMRALKINPVEATKTI